MKDWISLIESAYRLCGDDQQWLDQLFDSAKRLFGAAAASDAWIFSVSPTTFALGVGRTSNAARRVREEAHAAMSTAAIDAVYRRSWRVATASEKIAPSAPDQFELLQQTASRIGGGASDVWSVKCTDGLGSGVIFVVALERRRNPTTLERKHWTQAAAHLGAASRLRKTARAFSLDSDPVEAILDSCGNLHDARGQAHEPNARQKLREALRQIEHSRQAARQGDPRSLDHWQGLVDGRWSLVDHFDTDGKRFVVAVKNNPVHPDPRGLTARERQIAEYVGMGSSSKEIAYVLGISVSAVGNGAARVQAKLGLSSRSEIAFFFAPNGLRRKLAEVAISNERFLVGAYPFVDAGRVSCLTQAELEVAADIIAGSTNEDIAKRRGRSEHTVANQACSIFAKLNVHSRSGLAARIQAQIGD